MNPLVREVDAVPERDVNHNSWRRVHGTGFRSLKIKLVRDKQRYKLPAIFRLKAYLFFRVATAI